MIFVCGVKTVSFIGFSIRYFCVDSCCCFIDIIYGIMRMKNISPKIAFALVSFFLGELGDGLNIFQVRICDAYHMHKIEIL